MNPLPAWIGLRQFRRYTGKLRSFVSQISSQPARPRGSPPCIMPVDNRDQIFLVHTGSGATGQVNLSAFPRRLNPGRRTACDAVIWRIRRSSQVSIHAGARPATVKATVDQIGFQSTQAHGLRRLNGTTRSCFNPAGARPATRRWGLAASGVSIPQARLRRRPDCSITGFQSTQAHGCDAKTLRTVPRPPGFQSTQAHGLRHAPTGSSGLPRRFNPRRRTACDLLGRALTFAEFQSTQARPATHAEKGFLPGFNPPGARLRQRAMPD